MYVYIQLNKYLFSSRYFYSAKAKPYLVKEISKDTSIQRNKYLSAK